MCENVCTTFIALLFKLVYISTKQIYNTNTSKVFMCIYQIHYWNMFEILLQKCLSEVGFEPTPAYADQNTHNSQQCKQGIILESGALDHSAILTAEIMTRIIWVK